MATTMATATVLRRHGDMAMATATAMVYDRHCCCSNGDCSGTTGYASSFKLVLGEQPHDVLNTNDSSGVAPRHA